jgi:hypothetical protein
MLEGWHASTSNAHAYAHPHKYAGRLLLGVHVHAKCLLPTLPQRMPASSVHAMRHDTTAHEAIAVHDIHDTSAAHQHRCNPTPDIITRKLSWR